MPRSAFSVAAPPRSQQAEAAAPAPPESPPEARVRTRSRPRLDGWRLAPTLIAVALAGVYLVVKPRSPDLAAHIFRSELFGREGFTIWNGHWYGGHHTPAYSVLSPPIGWLLGPQLMGALSAVVATACFTEIARKHFGPRAARLGTVWFGIASATLLFTNRLPFALGTAFGVAAVLALQRNRRLLAPILGVLCAISSPVSGLFLAMVGLGQAVAAGGGRTGKRRGGETAGAGLPAGKHPDGETAGAGLPASKHRDGEAAGAGLPASKRRHGVALAASAFVPPVALALAFPEGGYAPYPFSAYVPIPLFAVACLVALPRSQRTLRAVIVLYALGATLALAIPTAMGGNAVRFGALLGGPVVACALAGRWRRPVMPVAILLAGLAFWQWSPAVRDIYKAIDDPVAKASYFDPVREYFRLLPDQRRVEIPFTFGHWEGAEVASEVPLARGWLRQLDTGRNELFYRGVLNELTYASWLSENAVRYVALPDAKPDRSSYRERALIERGLPYLKLRAEFDHWRIYEVTLPTPIVISRGNANVVLEQLGSDALLLRVRKPGDALVRVRWTPYWLAKGGCVQREGKWTRVTAEKEGFIRLVTRFSPERVLQRGRRCNTA